MLSAILSNPGNYGTASIEEQTSAQLAYAPLPKVNGQLVQDPDFTLPTAAGPVSWRLFYASEQSARDLGWGSRRRASWPLRLQEFPAGGITTVVLERENGNVVHYVDTGSGFAPVTPGVYDSLVQNGDGTWDETRRDTGARFHYPSGSYVSLSYFEAVNGPRVTFHYDTGKMTSLEDPAGRRLTYGYTGIHVTRVEDWGQRVHSLVYSPEGNLVEVEGPTGCVTQYEYDSASLLTSILDPEGFEATYTYDLQSRVVTRSVAGNLGRYTYGFQEGFEATVYTDPLGRIWTSLFDTAKNVRARIDPLGHRSSYEYNSSGQRTVEQNPLGAVWSTAYDSHGRMTGRETPLGDRETWTYDSYGNQLTYENPLGFVWTNAWEGTGQTRRLQTAQSPLGYVTSYGYNAFGSREYVEDPLGYRTTWQWNTLGLLVEEVNALGYCTTYEYDLVGNRIARIDALGNRWSFYHDPMGRVVAQENPLGYRRSTLYDARGMVQAEIDPLGYRTEYLWNAEGSRTALINALGYRTTWEYDAANQNTAQEDALGNRTSFQYDLAGRLVAVENARGYRSSTVYDAASQPVAAIDALGYRTSMVYDTAGRLIAHVNAFGYPSSSIYDSAGQRTANEDAVGSRWTTVYDQLGLPIAFIDPLGQRTTMAYDPRRQMICHIDALGFRSTNLFDGVGRRISHTNRRGYTTTYQFEPTGLRIATEDAIGARTTIHYDAVGLTNARLNARGVRTTFSYDPRGLQIVSEDPLGRRWTTTYDALSRIETTLDPKGQTDTYSYDPIGRRIGTELCDGTRITRSYDEVGLLVEANDATGITTQSFDPLGRIHWMLAPSHPGGVRLTYEYDAAGSRTAMRIGTQHHTYNFDILGRNTGYCDPEGSLTTWSYDRRSQLISQESWAGVSTTLIHDARGLVANVKTLSGHVHVQSSVSYCYDANENPLIRRTGSEITEWVYDEVDQLVREFHEIGVASTWTYDLVGNRLKQEVAQSGVQTVTLYEYDAADQLKELETLGHITSFGFDANGNQVYAISESGIKTYIWDSRDLLIGIETHNAHLGFSHRFDGRRASIEHGNPSLRHSLIWDAGDERGIPQLLAESSPEMGFSRQYWRGNVLVSCKVADEKSLYEYDINGNINRLFDANGSVVAEYDYDAWGQLLGSVGDVSSQPLRFGGAYGYYSDSLVDISLGLRELSTSLGRFLSIDPVILGRGRATSLGGPSYLALSLGDATARSQDITGNIVYETGMATGLRWPHPYGYAWNNPLQYTDIVGEYPWRQHGFGIGRLLPPIDWNDLGALLSAMAGCFCMIASVVDMTPVPYLGVPDCICNVVSALNYGIGSGGSHGPGNPRVQILWFLTALDCVVEMAAGPATTIIDLIAAGVQEAVQNGNGTFGGGCRACAGIPAALGAASDDLAIIGLTVGIGIGSQPW